MELEAVYSAAPSAEVYSETVFFIRVLRFSPISIFHQCSILIHSSVTDAI
jgi:hypothetical protein